MELTTRETILQQTAPEFPLAVYPSAFGGRSCLTRLKSLKDDVEFAKVAVCVYFQFCLITQSTSFMPWVS